MKAKEDIQATTTSAPHLCLKLSLTLALQIDFECRQKGFFSLCIITYHARMHAWTGVSTDGVCGYGTCTYMTAALSMLQVGLIPTLNPHEWLRIFRVVQAQTGEV